MCTWMCFFYYSEKYCARICANFGYYNSFYSSSIRAFTTFRGYIYVWEISLFLNLESIGSQLIESGYTSHRIASQVCVCSTSEFMVNSQWIITKRFTLIRNTHTDGHTAPNRRNIFLRSLFFITIFSRVKRFWVKKNSPKLRPNADGKLVEDINWICH